MDDRDKQIIELSNNIDNLIIGLANKEAVINSLQELIDNYRVDSTYSMEYINEIENEKDLILKFMEKKGFSLEDFEEFKVEENIK